MDSENQSRGPLGKKALSEPTKAEADKIPKTRRCRKRSAGKVGHSQAPTIPPEAEQAEDWTFTVCPTGPFRRPDFRWRSARLLLDRVRFPPEWVDDWIRLAVRLLKVEGDVLNLLPPGQLTHVATARRLAEHGSEWDRIELEARILAGESPADIGGKLGLAAEVIEIYEKLFFAVTDRLQAKSWIANSVIHINEEIAYRDVGVHLRHIGFFGGPIALNGYLDALRPERARESLMNLPPEELEEGRRLARLSIKLRMTPVTPKNGLQWMRLNLMRQLGVG